MIKRTIEISGLGNRLSVSNGSLVVERDGERLALIPVEDIGVLVLDACDTVYTHRTITSVLEAGAAIVPCGSDHLPAAMFLPQNNSLQTQRMAMQAGAPIPLRKRLWKQVVRGKIANQARAVGWSADLGKKLRKLAGTVRSGDPHNVEAHAARIYWPAMFGKQFRRDRNGPCPNSLLNYGYMALRAAVARAICGAGLHPSLGLHHKGRCDTHCLADDLVEPIRPLVDLSVQALWHQGCKDITRRTKQELLGLLTAEVEVAGQRGPLLVGLARMAASLVYCYARRRKDMELPVLCKSADTDACGS